MQGGMDLVLGSGRNRPPEGAMKTENTQTTKLLKEPYSGLCHGNQDLRTFTSGNEFWHKLVALVVFTNIVRYCFPFDTGHGKSDYLKYHAVLIIYSFLLFTTSFLFIGTGDRNI